MITRMVHVPTALLLVAVLLSSCHSFYSFKGISIDDRTKTFYVAPFEVSPSVNNIEQNYTQTLAERLKDKIRTESSLTYSSTDPHVEFTGTVVKYRISNEAPQDDQTVAFARLTIGISLDYTDHIDETKSWTKNFEIFANYDPNESLGSIQSELIREINDGLVENIFNDAFTQW